MSTGMLIDGIFASEAIDSSGEILSIAGADISDLEEGKGVLNYEHRGDDANGASPNDVIGKIVYVKKVYGLKDCESERQREYWKQLELPFIYGIARLYDGAGHPGAISAAAMIRDHVANGEQILARYSIEGSTLDRDGNRLKHTMARRVALTLKPCNRSCNTGMLADPNAPAGFEKPEAEEAKDLLAEFAENKKSEATPDLMKLGMSVGRYHRLELTPEHLEKTLAAGGYNAMPGSLVGGAALQVEDQSLHRASKNRARAALRDWNGKEPFRKYLDGKLPDASPEFLDRFADMVEDYKVKKAQARPEDPNLFQPMEKMAPPPGPSTAVKQDDDEPDWVGEGNLTIRGKPAKLSSVGKHAQFDMKTGILHTQHGQFPMHLPHRDTDPRGREGFAAALADPKPSAVHAHAMKNWRRAHDLLKAGKLPDAVIMHSALFGLLSANTPVPVQEMMYGHLVDTMKEKKLDARNPDFKWLKPAWLRRDNPTEYPRSSHDHFLRNDHLLRVKAEHNDDQGRMPGEIKAFQLASGKFENMARYHNLHRKLVDLLQHHGHDVRSAAEDMMTHKMEHRKWELARQKELAAGQQDRGEFPGMQVRGFRPKIARYMMGMLGGGNVVVPDTHFIRHLFGLDRQLDTPTIDYLKNVISNPGNSQVLNGIDQFYQQNHPVMDYVRKMPELHGVSDEDLIFPAFWRHWSAIIPHEQARGMRTGGYNEFTDHQPFWDAIHQYLQQEQTNRPDLKVVKSDQDALHTALDAVNEHMQWSEHLGEAPAQLLYWAILAPKLLGNAEMMSEGPDANGEVDKVGKFEALAVNLAIIVEDLQKKVEEAHHVNSDKPPETVAFAGQRVRPGKVTLHDSEEQLHVIGQDDKNFFVVPHGNFSWQPHEVKRLSKLGHGVGYRVDRWPETVGSDKVVSAAVHGHPMNRTPEQVKLIHGLDVGKKKLSNRHHEQQKGFSGDIREWRKGPTGVVMMKHGEDVRDFPTAHSEVAYYNAARDVFGLGDYLPVSALIKHPVTGQDTAVIQKLKDAHHGDWQDPEFRTHLGDMHNRGELDRLGLMDYVLGNTDRTDTNMMMTPEGLKLIDHAFGFSDSQGSPNLIPDYLNLVHGYGGTRVIHPEAGRWIRGITPEKLSADLVKSGVPAPKIEAALYRLSRAHEFYELDPAGFSWTDLVDLK